MTIWSTILLLTMTAYCTFRWIRTGWRLHPSFILNALPLLTLATIFAAYLVPVLPDFPFQEDVAFWSGALAVCASLAFIAELTRRLKPIHYQYPKIMTFIPFLLLGVFPFLRHSAYLTGLLLNLVLLAGVLSLWITSLTVFRHLEKPGVLIMGVMSATAALVMEWILPEIGSQHPWTVHLAITVSMPLFVNAFPDIEAHLDN